MAVLLGGAAELKFGSDANGALSRGPSDAQLYDTVERQGSSTATVISGSFGSLSKGCTFRAAGGSSNRAEMRPTTQTSDDHHISGSAGGFNNGWSIFGDATYLSQGRCYVDATSRTVYYYIAATFRTKPSQWSIFTQMHPKGGVSPIGVLTFGGGQIRAGKRHGVSSGSGVNSGSFQEQVLHSSFTLDSVVYEFVVGFRLSTVSGGSVRSDGSWAVWTRENGSGAWVKKTPASWDNTQIGCFVNNTVPCGAYPKLGCYQSTSNSGAGELTIWGARWADTFESAASMAFAGGQAPGGGGGGPSSGTGGGSSGSGSANFVQKDEVTVSSGTSFVFTPEAGAVPAGQQIIVAIVLDNQGGTPGAAITPAAGFVKIADRTSAAGERLQVFRKTATASEPTSYTFTAAATSNGAGVLSVYRNIGTG